jgi:Flp pilus assembly protein TadD
MPLKTHRARLLASVASVAVTVTFALILGGCQTASSPTATGSINPTLSAHTTSDARRDVASWAQLYNKNPQQPEAAIGYAQALRATGQRSQAAAVLEQASINNPKNTAVLGAYGRALADTGNSQQALEVLGRAHTPDQPDWRILSAQGAVLDQMGRHEEAQRHYSAALKIVPDEASVLSNLGLSYALSKNLPKAEATLRKASEQRDAEPRVRQNLALVVGLQGRFAEAETIARGDLSPEEAAANVAYLRQMLAQQDDRKKPRGSRGALKQAGRS